MAIRGVLYCKPRNTDHILKKEYLIYKIDIMKTEMKSSASSFADLTPHEMRQISGGGVWDKLLTALMGTGLSAFYEMGKQEGRLARQRVL